jgi:hypothetical protein
VGDLPRGRCVYVRLVLWVGALINRTTGTGDGALAGRHHQPPRLQGGILMTLCMIPQPHPRRQHPLLGTWCMRLFW